MDEKVREQIRSLKKEKDAVILAHYYVDGEVQQIADFVGDSYFLAKKATEVSSGLIIFCGVSFMGETAKILNPEKKVVMADRYADCPMAHMIEVDRIKEIRDQYPDAAVVCYVNSTAEVKSASDVCVTSSNAVKIVKKLANKYIFFIPDNNLGRYVAEQAPDKKFIFHDGFCHVHKSIHRDELLKAKETKPDAEVLAHPECTGDVLAEADFIGSTSQIIDYATDSAKDEFIICTEMGIFHGLHVRNPLKKFYSVGHRQFCPNMKRIRLESVLDALQAPDSEVRLEEEIRIKAEIPLKRMLELA